MLYTIFPYRLSLIARLSMVLMLAWLLTACRGNSDGQDTAAQDAGEQLTEFFEQTADGVGGNTRKKNDGTVATKRPQGIEIPAALKDKPEVILRRTGYTVSYNTKTQIPNWVAWKLTASHTRGSAERGQEIFNEDTEAPYPRVTDADYYGSGFDRGHMCPAGDNKWDRRAMNETFLFTNVCPQVHRLNAGPWNDLEMACRRWARELGEIYIVCGPLLSGGQHRTIGRHKVVVPERFFKVILCNKGTPKAIGFIYDNDGHNSEKMFSHATTVDEVERLTGIDFFPRLEDKIENLVEANRGYF